MKLTRTYGRHPRFWLDDREISEAEFLEASAQVPDRFEELLTAEMLASQTASLWPLRSEALAVSPRQVEAANERNRRHGIATRYNRNGTAIIPSAADRAKLIRLEGFRDQT